MKVRGIASIVSIGVIGGFIAASVTSIRYVAANAYISYGMFRLAALTLRDNLNATVVLFCAIPLALCMPWLLAVEKLHWPGTRAIKTGAVVVLILATLSSLEWSIRRFTVFDGVFTAAKSYAMGVVSGLRAADISLGYFLGLFGKHIKAVIALFILVVIVKLVRLIFSRLNWERVLLAAGKVYRCVLEAGCIRKTALVLIVLVVLLNLGIFVDSRIYPARGPNLVIVLIDTLRKDRLGIYGYGRDTSPNIDRFARDAIVLDNPVSQSSWTSPSVASLFTSLYPSVHGVISYGSTRADSLNYRLVTLAEALKEKGYSTGAFVTNNWISEKLQYNQGFDVFDPIDMIKAKPPAPELNEKALAWIENNRDRPFFAYLHYMDVHRPYDPPPPYDSSFKSTEVREMSEEEAGKFGILSAGRERDKNDLNYYKDRYDGGIKYVDHHIGRLLKRLEETGALDNTILVITSDHGEAFFEHGFCDHGWTLYNEEIEIPLIVKLPDSIRLPDLSRRNVQMIDISNTLLLLLNCRLPYDVDGRDLSSVTDGEPRRGWPVFSEDLSAETGGAPKITMIKEGFKAIYMAGEGRVTELYNLDEDPSEKNNVIGRHPETAGAFEAEIEARRELNSRRREDIGLLGSTVDITDRTMRERLKALGYLQ